MHRFPLILLVVISFFVANRLLAQPGKGANCFSLLAGKDITRDGCVLLAHNEDDWGDLYVDWHKVPRIQHESGSVVTLEKGGQLEQVPETWSFLWLEMPGMQFSDSYMNEWGVTVASNQCRSREDQPELESGGIGYFLRRIMIERAKTAREAVRIGGALVEKFGYHYSGRTYLIADANEGWMMSVVQGKHWVAQRIPDDQMAIIPNYYTIQEIDLADTIHFYGSADIITYALDRGWFDPNKGKRFNFREAYADIETLYGIWNIPRHLCAINYFSEPDLDYGYDLPFAFTPYEKIDLSMIMEVMANHGEGSEFEIPSGYNKGNPHGTTIKKGCSEGNQYSLIAQLRTGFPDPIAHVMWLAPKRPCIQPFMPWYIGISEIPDSYTRGNPQACLASHFSDTQLRDKTADKAYWVFKDYTDACDMNYSELSLPMKNFKEPFQKNLLEQQAVMEEVWQHLYETNPVEATNVLNNYVRGLADQLLNFTQMRLEAIRD